jgi:hypothetical protein
MITVSTTGGATYEGELFAIDPITRSIAVKTVAGAYAIVNSNSIESISGELGSFKSTDIAKLGLR